MTILKCMSYLAISKTEANKSELLSPNLLLENLKIVFIFYCISYNLDPQKLV
jgi:hypothetical protein